LLNAAPATLQSFVAEQMGQVPMARRQTLNPKRNPELAFK